jgi:hypothetical protein
LPDTVAKPVPNAADGGITRAATGRAITLMLIPSRSVIGLVPAWAVLCGALAAGGLRWTYPGTLSPQPLIALGLTVFIVEVLWATWRALLVDIDWADCFTRYPLPKPRAPVPGLPYTTPWSPLGRLLGRASQWRVWAETAPLEARGAWFTLPWLPPLAWVLSAVVGWPLVVLSFAALALSLLEWRTARRDQVRSALQAAALVGLGWLAGYTLLHPLDWTPRTWASVTLACCYAIAYQGALALDRQASLAPPHRHGWPLALLCGGQAAALALLVLLEQPVVATLAGLMLAPQLLLLAQLRTDAPRWYLRHAVPFMMGAMLVGAWAV